MSDRHPPELNWPGKEERPPTQTPRWEEDSSLSYCNAQHSTGHSLFDNRLLFGDNLYALQALMPEFAGKIRCVFADPPYNTQSAFAHFEDDLQHSLWLTMMRDRLELMHDLLSPEGSLWITLDDNEVYYLKVLCDEIFERRNFIATVIWQKKYTQANDATFFSDNHDYLLVYAKERSRLQLSPLPRDAQHNAAYRNPDGDLRGPWKSTPLHAKSGTAIDFEFTFANGVVWKPPRGTFPRFSVETMRRMDANNEIWFGADGKGVPSRKTFLAEVRQDVCPKSLWLFDEVGHNHEARTEARNLNPKDPFTTPKPERLLQRVLHLATCPGDWVLDAFAGSGTTGAVAHKMGRRWIMVERGLQCHTHILPRMRRVIDGEDPGGITRAVGWQGGGGFRYYRVVCEELA